MLIKTQFHVVVSGGLAACCTVWWCSMGCCPLTYSVTLHIPTKPHFPVAVLLKLLLHLLNLLKREAARKCGRVVILS